MTVSAGSAITTSSYNNIRSTISQILNPSVTGYGPGLLESTTATLNMTASAQHWQALYNDVNKSIKHQTGSNIPGISAPSTNQIITANFVNTLANSATIAVLNSTTVHPSQLEAIVSATLFTSTVWTSYLSSNRVYQWDSSLEANYHFNLGGYISTNFLAQGTASNAADADFAIFINNSKNSAIGGAYNRAKWLGPWSTTSTSYSTSTVTGVFTATVSYTRASDSVTVVSQIDVPGGLSGINLLPITSSTLYVSTDAIGANRPSLATGRRLLTYNSLAPFNFGAGQRSNPQFLTLNNIGPEPISVTGITPSQNGVLGYVVSSATNLTSDTPNVVYLTTPFTVAAGSSVDTVVYYSQPLQGVQQKGTFYNSITILSNSDRPRQVVDTVQNVGTSTFDFNLNKIDTSQTYTYVDWQAEYSLSSANRILGQNIANTYYLSNTYFGFIGGKERWGLFRKPDAEGLKFWVDYTNSVAGGNFAIIAEAFFGAVDAATIDANRSLTPNKDFFNGFGYGDFSDRAKIDTTLTGGVNKEYIYLIEPKFGVIDRSQAGGKGYIVSLSNQQYNGSPSAEAVAAFQVTNSNLSGPTLTFSPYLVNNTGTYSTDLTVTVYGIDLDGSPANTTKTVNASLSLTDLSDGNLVQWVSGIEEDNAIMGMSYDRIGGQLVLTIGVGSGSDSSPTLDQNNYLPSFVDVNNLGVTADVKWGQFDNGYGLPMYKTTWTSGWGSFMQTYGVWPVNPVYQEPGGSYPWGSYITYRYKFVAPGTGLYTIEFSVDNTGYIAIDGSIVVDRTSPNSANHNVSHLGTINLDEGTHEIVLQIRNTVQDFNNPGGVAATIKNPSMNIVWSTLDLVRSSAPYLYWPEVYRIPIEAGQSKTYDVKNYLVKNSFPINAYPTGYYKYGDYFGSPGTSDIGNLLSVTSDGLGNLTFNWKPLAQLSSNESVNRTLIGLTNLPFYYSYFGSRKKNVGNPDNQHAGPNTLKLIGMTTQAVNTISVPTPGYSQSSGQITTFIPGVVSTTRSESIAPGRLYNATENRFVNVGYYAPVSRHWVADQTGDRRYSASKSLTFKHPASIISDTQIAEWGFDPEDCLIGKDFKLSRIQMTLDYYVEFWYGVLEVGMNNVNESGKSDEQRLTSLFHGPNGRGTFDQLGPWAIPDPQPNQLIYLIIVDQTAGARGFDNCILTVDYTPIAPFPLGNIGGGTIIDEGGGTGGNEGGNSPRNPLNPLEVQF